MSESIEGGGVPPAFFQWRCGDALGRWGGATVGHGNAHRAGAAAARSARMARRLAVDCAAARANLI
jgi:hypothetical protein